MAAERCPSCEEPTTPGGNYCRNCGAQLGPGESDSNAVPAEADAVPANGESTADPDAAAWTEADIENGKLLAAVAHLSTLVAWLFGPLIILLVSDNPFVVQNSKNAVMWQLMLAIYSILAAFLVIILVGIPILVALWLLNLVFVILATVKATEGSAWKYPFTPAI